MSLFALSPPSGLTSVFIYLWLPVSEVTATSSKPCFISAFILFHFIVCDVLLIELGNLSTCQNITVFLQHLNLGWRFVPFRLFLHLAVLRRWFWCCHCSLYYFGVYGILSSIMIISFGKRRLAAFFFSFLWFVNCILYLGLFALILGAIGSLWSVIIAIPRHLITKSRLYNFDPLKPLFYK